MGKTTFRVTCGLTAFCAVLTATSAYLAGATVKTLIIRTLFTTLVVGGSGFLFYLWLSNRHHPINKSTAHPPVGGNIDITVNDNEAPLEEWKPLQAEEISDDNTRVFPVRK